MEISIRSDSMHHQFHRIILEKSTHILYSYTPELKNIARFELKNNIRAVFESKILLFKCGLFQMFHLHRVIIYL